MTKNHAISFSICIVALLSLNPAEVFDTVSFEASNSLRNDGKPVVSNLIGPDSNETLKADFFNADRVVFLGDSNTNQGGYIHQFEETLRLKFDRVPELINLGLSSETCCGLSEPIHPFPRPNVQDRLERVFELAQPDLVFACYGMNDGIYHPFDPQRFSAFQNGINKIVKSCQARKIKLVLLTPPPFDPLPKKKAGKLVPANAEEFSYQTVYEDYDKVISQYAAWIMQQDNQASVIAIDIHTPMKSELSKQRETDPDFTFSNDGVHFNAKGHQVVAQAILAALQSDLKIQKDQKLGKLIQKSQNLSHWAWLSHVGHDRPNVQPGLPIKQAYVKINAISKQIDSLLNRESNSKN